MAKTVEEQPQDQTSATATKKGDYEALRDKVANANSSMDTARTRKGELIADAVENKHLHKGAFAAAMKLRKMDPVQRAEWLFHFDTYCDYENFTREDLFPDRETGDGDEDRDLRPRHLRQPGASVDTSAATSAVEQIKNDALAKVGRGPQHKPN